MIGSQCEVSCQSHVWHDRQLPAAGFLGVKPHQLDAAAGSKHSLINYL